MQQKNISITKTARYFILGDASEKIEEVWFVCHGYAQLANYFIKNFEVLDNGKNLIVAPEGLSRFYWKGFSDRVVASWMTREDRESDIVDYVNFLNSVYKEVLSSLKNKNVRINVLGFSQGTATVCRWIANNNVKVDNFILWAGAFPEDLGLTVENVVFERMKKFAVIGDQDEFLNEAAIAKQFAYLNEHNIPLELIRFHGKHEINKEALLDLQKRF
jgi:predicted esterase